MARTIPSLNYQKNRNPSSRSSRIRRGTGRDRSMGVFEAFIAVSIGVTIPFFTLLGVMYWCVGALDLFCQHCALAILTRHCWCGEQRMAIQRIEFAEEADSRRHLLG